MLFGAAAGGAAASRIGFQREISDFTIFSNFAGLRFDMDDKGWHSFLAMDELENQPDFDFKPIWQAMPMGASACVALPLAAEQQLLGKVAADRLRPAFALLSAGLLVRSGEALRNGERSLQGEAERPIGPPRSR